MRRAVIIVFTFVVEKETETMKMKRSFRVYWILQNIALVGAFGITAIYWLFIYNPGCLFFINFITSIQKVKLLVFYCNIITGFEDTVVLNLNICNISINWVNPCCYYFRYCIQHSLQKNFNFRTGRTELESLKRMSIKRVKIIENYFIFHSHFFKGGIQWYRFCCKPYKLSL